MEVRWEEQEKQKRKRERKEGETERDGGKGGGREAELATKKVEREAIRTCHTCV